MSINRAFSFYPVIRDFSGKSEEGKEKVNEIYKKYEHLMMMMMRMTIMMILKTN